MDRHKVKLCSRWCLAVKILFLWAHSCIWQKNTAKTFAGVAVPDNNLFKQEEHITVYTSRWKPSRSTALTHPLPSTTLQSSGLGSWAPSPLEQDDITWLHLHCTHHKCSNSQPDPPALLTADKTRDARDNQTADAAEMNSFTFEQKQKPTGG